MGSQASTFYTDCILQKVSFYDVGQLSMSYKQLSRLSYTRQEHVDRTTLVDVLPFSISLGRQLTQVYTQKVYNTDSIQHELTNWKDCLSALTLYIGGHTKDKVNLIIRMYELGGHFVSRQDIQPILHQTLQAAHRLYQADEHVKSSGQKAFFNINLLAQDILANLFKGNHSDKTCLLSEGDLQRWASENWIGLSAMSQLHTSHKNDINTQRSAAGHASKLTNQQADYKWEEVSHDCKQAYPSSSSKQAVCFYGGCVYMLGGKDGNIAHKHLWKYNLGQSQWERVACQGDKPILLQEHTMNSYQGKLYVFGGEFSASDETPLWILDLEKLKWKKHVIKDSEVMSPGGRRGHTAVLWDKGLHIYGGYMDLKGSTSELWTFDLTHGLWHLGYSNTLSDDGPGARHGHSAVIHAGQMWVYGGMADLQTNHDLWKWHFGLRKWTKVKCRTGPPPLHGHSAGKVDDGMIIFGGESNGILQNDLWKLHFSTQTWQKIQCDMSIPSARTKHCCMMIPSFVLSASETDRSQSLPHLQADRKTPLPSEYHARPFSSPPITTEDLPCTGVMFKNKVAPERCCHLSGEHGTSICDCSEMEQNSVQLIKHSDVYKSSSCLLDKQVTTTVQYFQQESDVHRKIDYDISTREHMLRSVSVDSINNTSLTFLEAAAVKSSKSFHLFRDHFTISTYGKMSGSAEGLLLGATKKTVPDHCGLDNPTFVTDLVVNYGSVHDIEGAPAQVKQRKHSLQSMTNIPENNANKSASLDSIMSIGNSVVPGVVESGSLESLMKGIGVNLQYINFGDSPQHKNKDLKLEIEDIENMDVTELEPFHQSPRKRDNPSQNIYQMCNKADESNKSKDNNQIAYSSSQTAHLGSWKREVLVGEGGDLIEFEAPTGDLVNIDNLHKPEYLCQNAKLGPQKLIDYNSCRTVSAEKDVKTYKSRQNRSELHEIYMAKRNTEERTTIKQQQQQQQQQDQTRIRKDHSVTYMYVFGGRESVAQNLAIRPISVWKLMIKMS